MKSQVFGFSPEQWALLEKLLFAPLKATGAIVWIFGSRARGDFRKYSDVDVLVEGSVTREQLSRIQEALDESDLPFRVDLVPEKELAEAYRAGVLRDRLRID